MSKKSPTNVTLCTQKTAQQITTFKVVRQLSFQRCCMLMRMVSLRQLGDGPSIHANGSSNGRSSPAFVYLHDISKTNAARVTEPQYTCTSHSTTSRVPFTKVRTPVSVRKFCVRVTLFTKLSYIRKIINLCVNVRTV